jgi:hypothetical protein
VGDAPDRLNFTFLPGVARVQKSGRPCENTASGRGGGNEVLGEFTEPGKFGW